MLLQREEVSHAVQLQREEVTHAVQLQKEEVSHAVQLHREEVSHAVQLQGEEVSHSVQPLTVLQKEAIWRQGQRRTAFHYDSNIGRVWGKELISPSPKVT